MPSNLSTIDAAIDAIARGEIIIVMDDVDRENEGDFICAAEKITPQIVNFMITHGRGMLCMPILPDVCQRLDLEPIVSENTAPHGTNFTVPIDHRTCRTGITAQERATTILAILDPASTRGDFVRPGHLYPLTAKEGGVLRRAGHTEAAVDLARLAGLKPAGALIEILDATGDRAPRERLCELARQHRMEIITIEDLIRYRRRSEKLVYRQADARLPTKYGDGRVIVYGVKYEAQEPVAIVVGDPASPAAAAGPAGAAPFLLLHRRSAGVAAVRLRRPAPHGPGHDQRRGGRRLGVSPPRGPRHRAGREDQGLRPPGQGHGHRRGQPGPGPPGR